MARVNWGVLGCASFARRRTIPAMLESPSVALMGVASRTAEKAESFRAEFNLPRAYASYDALLDDPQIQAVYIPLPNGLHAEWMIKAAEHGKHSLCEKPFASNAEEAAQVAEAAARRGVCVMEAFMWRMHPQHAKAFATARDGAVGPVRLVRSAFTFQLGREPNVRLVASLAGGSVMDVGCYPISAARYYFSDEPVAAFAQGDIDPEFGVDMRMSGILTFPNGRAVIDSGFNLPYRTSLEIVGEAGTIVVPKPWLPDPVATIVINGEPEVLPAANQYVNQFEYFSRCVLEGKPPSYGPADAIRQMRVIDAVLRSIHSGRMESV